MNADGGAEPVSSEHDKAPPENIVARSVRAFLIAPLIQNAVLWTIFITWMIVGTGGAVRIAFSSGFWLFAAGSLIVSYIVAGTLGVLVHVTCVKLGFWRLWQYLLAGFLAGAAPAVLWGLTIASQPSISRMTGLAIYFVPSALVVATVVWLMVFWRNPPVARAPDPDVFS
ncbi:MAG: hypothetical protein OEQ29_21075 [Alphaproteobacteria bacterium]|nr:hypothetical protein [Alphaproteobacteria bacterium]